MKGFFFQTPEKRKREPGPRPSKNKFDCEACGLYKGCQSPRMEVSGEGHLGVLIIAEAPGKTEDERGIQLVGDAGQLFREKLGLFGLDLDRDFWKINSVNCRPPSNREPSLKELKCCRPRIQEVINRLKPKTIWLMGNPALESFYLGKHFDNLTIGAWIRRKIPDRETGAWVVPLYHPSYMLRNQGNRVIESAYDRDLKQAVQWIGDDSPVFEDYENKVVCFRDFEHVDRLLRSINTGATKLTPTILFHDYETTGLKPYRLGHKIVSISLYWEGFAYSFPYQYPGIWNDNQFKKIESGWRTIQQNPNLKLGAHRLDFEDKWTRRIVGVTPRTWYWDTKAIQHIIDERGGTTGLKFQAFVRWGVYGYEDKMAPFIKSQDGEFNKMTEAPLDDLLLYGGLDSYFENKLYEEQFEFLSRNTNRGLREKTFPLYHEGVQSFCEMQDFGIHIDDDYFREESKNLGISIGRLNKRLLSSGGARSFEKEFGRPPAFSGNDLTTILFRVMKVKPTKLTVNKNPSVDEEALEQMAGEVPFVNILVKKRKYEKTKNTYIAQFTRESVNGIVYPSFNLDTARSGRSSSSDPNFQNIPVRDEEAKKTVRCGIIPSPGYIVAETDYKGIEVCVAGCLTKDPTLMAYLSDKTTDMHRDQAVELFLLKPEQMKPTSDKKKDEDTIEKIRYRAKNGWVFAQFYGSYYLSCARALWEVLPELVLRDGTPMIDHLAGEGIRRVDAFIEHLKGCEQKLWKRFPVFKEWQEAQIDFYCRRGYVENAFGFRRYGLSKRNEIINTPIQGTAFHCLLWSINRLMKIRREEGWRTKIPGQIHDSIWSDIYPSERDHYYKTQKQVMTQDIRKENSWIIVPLEIDIKEGHVDESWYYIRKVE